MRLRWLGMFLVALAIVVGTPMAFTMAAGVRWNLSGVVNYPFTNERVLENGVLLYESGESPPMDVGIRTRPRVSMLAFDWKRSGGETRIVLPVWPIPIAMVLVGLILWHRGSARSMRTAAPEHASPASRLVHHAWGAAIALAIGAGLASASIVALTVVRPLSHFIHGYAPGSLTPDFCILIERGGMGMTRFHSGATLGWIFRSPPPGPWTVRWDTQDPNPHAVLPIWPVPVVMLAIGGTAFVRRERSLLAVRKGHCLKCGYNLVATPGPVCPECGVRRP